MSTDPTSGAIESRGDIAAALNRAAAADAALLDRISRYDDSADLLRALDQDDDQIGVIGD